MKLYLTTPLNDIIFDNPFNLCGYYDSYYKYFIILCIVKCSTQNQAVIHLDDQYPFQATLTNRTPVIKFARNHPIFVDVLLYL